MPLKIRILYAHPILGARVLSPRLVSLRTALCAIESLKTGTTSLTDDVHESPYQTPEPLDAVFQAHDDVGLRATISGHVVYRPFRNTIPFARDFVPPDLAAQADALGSADREAWLAHCRDAFARLHGRSGRLTFVVAPSAPPFGAPALHGGADAGRDGAGRGA
jgi:cytosine/adenosine deaminase-related metal-dependent hydrolase